MVRAEPVEVSPQMNHSSLTFADVLLFFRPMAGSSARSALFATFHLTLAQRVRDIDELPESSSATPVPPPPPVAQPVAAKRDPQATSTTTSVERGGRRGMGRAIVHAIRPSRGRGRGGLSLGREEHHDDDEAESGMDRVVLGSDAPQASTGIDFQALMASMQRL